jgi:UDP-glucose:(heptosyl)LPS alpha-1,3-glucosyltransferase
MNRVLISMLHLHKNSGSARTAYENIHYFKSRGYQVHVAAMTLDRKQLQKEDVIVHQMIPWLKSTGALRRRWYNWQVQRLRKKLKPTITVGHGDLFEQDVLTLHNCVFYASELIDHRPLDPRSEMAIIHGKILGEQKFKKLIANSELMKKDCIDRFNIPEDKIHVVYPALDTNVFRPLPDKATLRARFNFPEKVVISLVTSGNLKKRGLDIFEEAIKLLPQEIREAASFRVLGKKEETSSLVFDPGLTDIESYFNAIDVFLLPARIEEFGRVVLEAIGCGLPVITTDKVGAAELLEDGSQAFIIPAENPAALADKLKVLIEEPELRQKLGVLNYQTSLKWSEEHVYQHFDQVFLSS